MLLVLTIPVGYLGDRLPRKKIVVASAVIAGVFSLATGMAPVLWVIAVLSNVTVIHRMIFTYQEAKRLEEAQLRPVAARERSSF